MSKGCLLFGLGLLRFFSSLTASELSDYSLLKNTYSDSVFIARELLGRPTDKSITINALAMNDLEVYFEYGNEPSGYINQTGVKQFPGGDPIEVVIDQLAPNTRYYYRMCFRQPGAAEFQAGEEHTFHTQRPRGSAFTFTVEADPHLDELSNPDIYRRTLQNILVDTPDFMIDLGDNFMTDKIPEINPGSIINYQTIVDRHLLLRGYYDSICHSVPLFLVIGNHEGELGWELNGTSENMAVWATIARKLYYPNPAPDHFYTGSIAIENFVGLRENYYAFEWGDALVVVIDPYWYTPNKPGKSGDNWDWTLGEQQYRWLRQTLENSQATFKFVLCHQLVGGKDPEGRGGSEYASYFEQGGLNADASWGFDDKRPGWGKPIHQIMVENHVTIFFHGHDHFYAKQDLDGIVYQLVPQPSHPNYEQAGQAIKYGYITGDILPNSGHLRVTVLNSMVTVDYVRAYLPADENPAEGRINGNIESSYTIDEHNTSVPATDLSKNVPQKFLLEQNYPNPFNASSRIQFYLKEPCHVVLKIFNLSGQVIKILADGNLTAEPHSIVWNGQDQWGHALPSGTYFYQLKTERFQSTRKLVLLR